MGKLTPTRKKIKIKHWECQRPNLNGSSPLYLFSAGNWREKTSRLRFCCSSSCSTRPTLCLCSKPEYYYTFFFCILVTTEYTYTIYPLLPYECSYVILVWESVLYPLLPSFSLFLCSTLYPPFSFFLRIFFGSSLYFEYRYLQGSAMLRPRTMPQRWWASN